MFIHLKRYLHLYRLIQYNHTHMKNKHIVFAALFLLVSGYSFGQTTVGGDSDKHGCKASAGYTYSTLKKECVRVFEQPIQLVEVSPKGSFTAATALVFDATQKKAEVFLSDLAPGSLVLTRKSKTDVWKKGAYELRKINSGYSLKKAGVEIFKSK